MQPRNAFAALARAVRHPDIQRDTLVMMADDHERALPPPTVAELLPMVDATHEVWWDVDGEERRAIDGGDGQIHFQWRTSDGSRWRDHIVNHADLTAPARLVEVA